MIRLDPAEHPDSPILICSADRRLRGTQDSEASLKLQRSIKAHCILGGSVTLPSSLMLNDSDVTQAVFGVAELLKEGLLLPDLRVGVESFKELVGRSSVHSTRSATEKYEAAAFLDSSTKLAISYDPSHTSRCYTINILRMLLFKKIRNECDISWRALRQVTEDLLGEPIVGTKQLQEVRTLLRGGRLIFDRDSQLLYHIIGATVTGSSPLLPETFDQALRDLLGSLDAAYISDGKGVLLRSTSHKQDMLAINDLLSKSVSLNELLKPSVKSLTSQFALIELLATFSIQDSLLDRLDGPAVVDIAKSSEAKRVRKIITETYEAARRKGLESQVLKIATRDSRDVISDFRASIRDRLKKESTTTKRLGRITSTIGWAGVAVGIATLPLSGAAALGMSLGGVLLSASGSSIDSWNQLYSKPMLTLIERIESKAQLSDEA
jgi:hypothetical protein